MFIINDNTRVFSLYGKKLIFKKKNFIPISDSLISHSEYSKDDINNLDYYSTETLTVFTEQNLNRIQPVSILTDSDDLYYSNIANKVKDIIEKFCNYDPDYNERRLIYTSDTDCISLINIIPTLYTDKVNVSRKLLSYNVFIYQRSAYLTALIKDLHFISNLFNSASHITYVVNNIHYLNKQKGII